MSARRGLGLGLAALLASCASAGVQELEVRSISLCAPGETIALQHVALTVDDGDPRTPPIRVATVIPAGSEPFGVGEELSNLLVQRGCPSTSESEPFSARLRLRLSGGYRFTDAVVQRWTDGEWGPPGSQDLRLCAAGAELLTPNPPPHY
ncbi:MAG: hypothetical protein EXS08_15915 [Planctomycetes bacterium]|nr:hypothetical protein [Planctomycetota bacterium]